jgi:putative ABC transport system permease protein
MPHNQTAVLSRGDRFEQIRHDARHAWRTVWRNRAHSGAIVATLALGLGTNAAMVGLLDRLLLQPPAHVQAASDLYQVGFSRESATGAVSTIPTANFPQMERLAAALPDYRLAGYYGTEVSVGEGTSGRRIRVQFVSDGFFAALGVVPASGVLLRGNESEPVAVVSSDLDLELATSSAHRPDVVRVGLIPHRIVGVAPPGFGGLELAPARMWLPLSSLALVTGRTNWKTDELNAWLRIVARVPASTNETAAAARLTSALTNTNAQSILPATMLPKGVELSSLVAARNTRYALEVKVTLVLGLIAIAVLLACAANVANLVLVRLSRRATEISVRVALGASRLRLASQLMGEVLILALFAAVIGLVLAHWMSGAMMALLLPDVQWPGAVVSIRVFLATLGAALVLAALICLAPLRQQASTGAAEVLRTGAATVNRGQAMVRSALFVTQAALALLLVNSAGLFIKSIRNVRAIDTGMDVDRVALLSFSLPAAPELGYARELYDRAADQIRKLPGVETVSLFNKSVPLREASGVRALIPGRVMPRPAPGAGPYYSGVDSSFFRTFGMRVKRGRGITSEDIAVGARVMVINSTMARSYWENAEPLGACVILGDDTDCTTIVGVADDVIKFKLMGETQPSFLYLPSTHYFLRNTYPAAIGVRTTRPADEVVPRIVRIAQEIAPQLPYPQATALSTVLAPQLRPWRLGAVVLFALGVLTLVVCAIGLFGLVSYLVTQRTREVGIRVALGADPGAVRRLIVFQGVRLTLAGLIIGAIAALAAGRTVQALLVGVSARDPLMLTVASAVLLAVAVVACVVPAHRATRIDPTTALRSD